MMKRSKKSKRPKKIKIEFDEDQPMIPDVLACPNDRTEMVKSTEYKRWGIIDRVVYTCTECGFVHYLEPAKMAKKAINPYAGVTVAPKPKKAKKRRKR